MRDVLFVLLTAGFFALAVAYVRACAVVAGDDGADRAAPADGEDAETEAVT